MEPSFNERADELVRIADALSKLEDEVDDLEALIRNPSASQRKRQSALKAVHARVEEKFALLEQRRLVESGLWRVTQAKPRRLIGSAAVAAAGVSGMVAIALASYSGWPDVVNNALRAMNVHVPDLEHVSFAQTVIYLVIIAATTIWLVHALRNHSDE